MRVHQCQITVAFLIVACSPKEPARAPAAGSSTSAPAHRVATTTGLSNPESALWDADQGVWFVSNVNGSPSAKDNNGFISRLRADGAIDSLRFIASGRDGVTLNAPKGLVLVADTLWVTDIDAIRGFNKRTGALVASVELGRKATFLNDPALGPDGTVYITDTGIQFDEKGQMTHPSPDRIFALKGRAISVAAEGDWLERPNGITWDASADRFIVAPVGGPRLLGWKPGMTTADTIGTSPGGQDGVERLPDGPVLFSSWADSTVDELANGTSRRIITGVSSPGDFGVDPVRRLLALPMLMENRVEFWQLDQ